MNFIKIIFGFILLIGAGREYASASRQLGTFLNVGVIIGVFLFILLSTWLLGSGFSKRKLKLKSFDYLKYLIISLVVFVFVAFFSLISKNIPTQIVEFNGVKIAIDNLDEGSRNLYPDNEERKKYCLCIAEKLANCEEITSKYSAELSSGKLEKIITEIQNEDFFLELGIESCMMNSNIEWTDNFADGMVKNWKKELRDTDFENTNDIDVYCNCLINQYRQQPLSFILSEAFMESEFANKADILCTETSDLESLNINK